MSIWTGFVPEQGAKADCCENSNEPQYFIKYFEFIDQLSDCLSEDSDSDPHSYFAKAQNMKRLWNIYLFI